MARPTLARILLTTMVLLGALLGFSMQPLVGRVLASTFGSGVDVWLASMMFFQGALFGGYLYAHVVAPRLGRWHLLVLLLPLVFLPPVFGGVPRPGAGSLDVLASLGQHVMVPFLLVATTSVVAQSWLSRSDLDDAVEPYPLYAASNIGSLVGLLGYPLVVERVLGLQAQGWTWTGLYVAYAVVVGATFVVVRPGAPAPLPPSSASRRPGLADIALWMGLAAVPSAFLLAVTNTVVLEVGSLPLVWVLPLAAYLGSFIVAFRSGAEHLRASVLAWPELTLIILVLALVPSRSWALALAHIAALTAVAWMAHLTLYLRRPHPRYLTLFYLAVALGGWIGGASVSIGAPVVFDRLLEYPLTGVAFGIVMAMVVGRETFRRLDRGRPVLRWTRLVVVALLALAATLALRVAWSSTALERVRNFYGVMAVHDLPEDEDGPARRVLQHGATLHGRQALAASLQDEATAYYGDGGCIAQGLSLKAAPRRVAVIGLGAGVLAAQAEPGDTLRFFEIDADVERIAREWFTFLDRSPATSIEVVIGDGRLELATRDETYDVIVLDAFSGDSVPFHLLTREAVAVWTSRLEADGVLVVHVSNRFFELRPVLAAHADALELAAFYNETRDLAPTEPFTDPADCVVLARSDATLAPLAGRSGWAELTDAFSERLPWTDDHADLLGALRTPWNPGR